MDEEIELLVHAGAPSSRKDDDGYITQARNYVDAQVTQHGRTGLTTAAKPTAESDTSHCQDTVPPNVTAVASDQSTFLDDTQLAYEALESQIITDSIAAARPGVVPDEAETVVIDCSGPDAAQLSALHSESSETSHLKTPQAGNLMDQDQIPPPGGIYASQVAAQQDETSPSSRPDNRAQSFYSTTHEKPNGRDAHRGDESTSELPTSYSLTDSASTPHKRHTPASDNPHITEPVNTQDPGSTQSDKSPVREGYTPIHMTSVVPPPSAANLFSPDLQSDQAKSDPIPVLPVPASSPHHSPHHVLSSCPISLHDDFSIYPLTISPSPPPVSTEIFKSHLTPALLFLATDSPVADCYRPISVTRVISPLERGHWLVERAFWPLEATRPREGLRSTFVEFWKFLLNFVGNGTAGWGVWVTREEAICSDRGEVVRVEWQGDETDGHGGEGKGESDRGEGGEVFGPVKVYCWGEVVEHVFLMLYVASNSRVRRMGLVWVDGEGKVVVRMRDR